MAQTQETPQTDSMTMWQQWVKKRAQQVPLLDRVHDIARKVPANVTQLLLDERHEK